MPTYDYHCKACGAEMEIFQSITESPKRKCPQCGKLKLNRRIGAGAGILFKGGGFYETDYRSASYKAGESAEKSKSEKSSDKPSDKAAKKKKSGSDD